MKASQTYKIPAYALACALLTTLAGWLAAHRPTVLQMEYAVYDAFQKYATVDVYPDEKPVGEPLQPKGRRIKTPNENKAVALPEKTND